MKTNIFKISFPDRAGAMYVSYEKGQIRMLLNELSETPKALYIYMMQTDIDALQKEFPSMRIAELTPKTVAEKVAMFCIVHKNIKSFVYRAGKEEKANLKLVTVSRELLEIYFNNAAYPMSASKSMADYVKHYNFIRDIQKNGKPEKIKTRFPDVYDREFERTLEGETLSAYWQHLHKLGWRKIDGVWLQNQN